jgi:hypothetical protein
LTAARVRLGRVSGGRTAAFLRTAAVITSANLASDACCPAAFPKWTYARSFNVQRTNHFSRFLAPRCAFCEPFGCAPKRANVLFRCAPLTFVRKMLFRLGAKHRSRVSGAQRGSKESFSSNVSGARSGGLIWRCARTNVRLGSKNLICSTNVRSSCEAKWFEESLNARPFRSAKRFNLGRSAGSPAARH